MNIFNSLGSNYNLSFVLKSLTEIGSKNRKSHLEKLLQDKFEGEVTLFYKGREALEQGLKLLNLPKDSFAAICGFTCFAVYEAVKKANLNIEYLDIEKGELNFSADELDKHLTKNPKIKVVIIQNTLGYPCNIDGISKICKQKKIILIEDLAHSVGSRYKDGSLAGSWGNMTILSFSQDKIIDGVSGGALITNSRIETKLENPPFNRELSDRFYPFLTYLIRLTYPLGLGKILHKIFRTFRLLSNPMGIQNDKVYSLSDWYCNLAKLSFTHLSENISHRNNIANIYKENINPKVISPKIAQNLILSTNLRFPIFVNNRIGLVRFLKERGVYISDTWYDAPIAPKRYMRLTDYKIGTCPNAELAADEVVNLPTHVNISESEALKISKLINQWLTSQ